MLQKLFYQGRAQQTHNGIRNTMEKENKIIESLSYRTHAANSEDAEITVSGDIRVNFGRRWDASRQQRS